MASVVNSFSIFGIDGYLVKIEIDSNYSAIVIKFISDIILDTTNSGIDLTNTTKIS